MQKGNNSINDLSINEKDLLLQSIIEDCVIYADDSYRDFAEHVIRTLKYVKLVDYGKSQFEATKEEYDVLSKILSDVELQALFNACDYNGEILSNWNQEMTLYSVGKVEHTAFIDAFENYAVLAFAEKYSEQYHDAKREQDEIER